MPVHRIGRSSIAGFLRWSAAIATMVSMALAPSPAAHASSPSRADQPHTIVLPVDGEVHTLVLDKFARDTLAYGLYSPRFISVCGDCQGGEERDLGVHAAGTELIFFLTDRSAQQRYFSTDPMHTRLVGVSATEYRWRIGWDDAGGDFDYNDLYADIILTPQ